MAHDPNTWTDAIVAVSGMGLFAVMMSLWLPKPWIVLGDYLRRRSDIKRIHAESRLLEAKVALKRQEAGDVG